VIEGLFCKHKALNSNLSHIKKKKKGLRNLKKNKNLEPQVLAIKIIV
jgi:hypothetical protein